VALDLAQLPLDDAKPTRSSRAATLRRVPAGKRGMRDSLRKLKPNRFEDIVAMNALYRPGRWTAFQLHQCQERRGGGFLPAPDAGAGVAGHVRVFTYQEQ